MLTDATMEGQPHTVVAHGLVHVHLGTVANIVKQVIVVSLRMTIYKFWQNNKYKKVLNKSILPEF